MKKRLRPPYEFLKFPANLVAEYLPDDCASILASTIWVAKFELDIL
tara:strand:+ start:1899 stop:2036 length:138 start_codon:yes stop_codon:yes gene_type:complete